MKSMLLTCLAIWIGLGVTAPAGYRLMESAILRDKINTIYDLLDKCHSSRKNYKRELMDLSNDEIDIHINFQKLLYEKLVEKLIECKRNAASPTTNGTTPTTAKMVATTYPAAATPCQRARNLTGSNLQLGKTESDAEYACGYNPASSEWFRFAGASANQILDQCPKGYQSKKNVVYWTDDWMPKLIEIEAEVEVYGSSGDNCKSFTRKLSVIRCSWDASHDFIYRKASDYNTAGYQTAFCGMKNIW